MKLKLKRTYHSNGTNGKLYDGDQLVCHTIELPWLNNRRNVSCIPEGIYELEKRSTEKRGQHLIIKEVPDRSGILLHPANEALKELKGCIAPVSKLKAPGIGSFSVKATELLQDLCFRALDLGERVFLIIQTDINMTIMDRVKAPTPKFFKVLRTIGLSLAAAGGAVLAAPISLPAGVLALGGYLVTGGAVLTAVSQSTVDEHAHEDCTA